MPQDEPADPFAPAQDPMMVALTQQGCFDDPGSPPDKPIWGSDRGPSYGVIQHGKAPPFAPASLWEEGQQGL